MIANVLAVIFLTKLSYKKVLTSLLITNLCIGLLIHIPLTSFHVAGCGGGASGGGRERGSFPS